jgi:hypothetical protein
MSELFLYRKTTDILNENKRIVCHASKPIEYIDSIEELDLDCVDTIEYAEDATLMRLYYHKESWQVSTRFVIDANDSKFASSYSFAELFWDTFDKKHLSMLNKENTYVFLLKHPLHRFILKHEYKILQLIEILSNNEINTVNCEPVELPFHGVHVITSNFQSISNKKEYINTIPIRDDKRGLMFIGENVKYLLNFEKFKELQKVRGSSSSLLERFCQIYFKKERKQQFLDTFCQEGRIKGMCEYADVIIKNYMKFLSGDKLKKFKKSNSKHLFNILCSYKKP